ncbi:DUF1648 domain-containing protein [Virgibacillus litoralis]|uniref:Membrane protein n=1 Tax=Virgibacillus litoralis TaxID=578221 RepID=A0ABS4HBA1_9BACI|nr:DUF1648 domain-containing protein [Virgibacillus litoralis]MBP1948019.1 putative membrane protein [Virgibacillus litoralis]
MKNHPKIKVSATKWEKFFNTASVIILICSIVYVVQAYNSLPESVPTHFNAKGEADAWGNKGTVLLMPAIAFVSFIIMYFVTKAPHTFNYMVKVTEENATRLYTPARTFMAAINLEMVAIFSYIAWAMVQSATSGTGLGISFIFFVILVPIATIISFMIKMNRVK